MNDEWSREIGCQGGHLSAAWPGDGSFGESLWRFETGLVFGKHASVGDRDACDRDPWRAPFFMRRNTNCGLRLSRGCT